MFGLKWSNELAWIKIDVSIPEILPLSKFILHLLHVHQYNILITLFTE